MSLTLYIKATLNDDGTATFEVVGPESADLNIYGQSFIIDADSIADMLSGSTPEQWFTQIPNSPDDL